MEIDWSTEWLSSLVWLGEVFLATLVGFTLIVGLIIRRTRWGRQFWRLSRDYFIPQGRGYLHWRPLLTAALMILLTLAGVRVDVVLSFSNNGLYTALQELDQPSFWKYIGIFSVIALVNLVVFLLATYIARAQVIHWWEWLNDRILGDWLGHQEYHRSRFLAAPVDNPDQRIQEDIATFTDTSQTLALGAISAVVSLVSFTLILWELSAPLPILGITVPRGMVVLAYLYVLVATFVAVKLGFPLVRLDFLNQRLNAFYRYALVRVRENSENIAFYAGEPVERRGLELRFQSVIGNNWAILYRNLKFGGFNSLVTQVSVIFPFIVQAPRFFASQITLGALTQSATAFGQVHGSLSFFRTSYATFASYRAQMDRLTGLLDTDAESRALPGAVMAEQPSGLSIRDLDVRRPDGSPFLTDLDLELPGGTSLLVKGPSGSGKTTLLRSLAGLWPYVSGTVTRPEGSEVMFCSQQPYLPLGTLRNALAYPADAATVDDLAAQEALRAVQLGHLVERLDAELDWARTLSPGEQQRLAFGRILLSRPATVFLDEATAAMDEGMEQAMYDLVRARLPETTIVSVGHRSTLEGLHSEELVLLGEGRWETKSLVA